MSPDAKLFAVIVVVAIIMIAIIAVYDNRKRHDSFASCAGCGGNNRSPPLVTRDRVLRRGDWMGGRGPYNLQLYDSPFYYPYYEAKDYMSAWDKAGRCSAYCSASEDGGCAVSCR